MTPGIQDRRSGTVQSPYRAGEVGLCRVHTGQEKWDCAESIQDRTSGTVQSPYIQNKNRY
ncbi:unnamed protein product [Staurois parvus]|uniref:Uncharacterized protein n=1 Tax=Staurois parvus TaxID=386267 RepID=A0ABN9DWM6_9NEOB|nr:unnamed protein product [Staurois parvus]